MKYRVTGNTLQALDVLLTRNEAVFTEIGGMAWYKGDIDMKTNVPGGLFGGVQRKMAGESAFVTTYTARSDQAVVTFTPSAPGSIVARELGQNESIIAQRDAFMCAQVGVSISIEFTRNLGAGFFGGEGFVLQRVKGPGVAFFEVDGEAREFNLPAGEVLHIDPGHIAMFDSTVTYGIERIKGVSNMLFGGEGLFLATLKGPGRVWLQTMPMTTLVAKIASILLPDSQ